MATWYSALATCRRCSVLPGGWWSSCKTGIWSIRKVWQRFRCGHGCAFRPNGRPSLGYPVNKALANRNLPLGIEAGLAIVILAILLDRALAFKSGDKK